MAQFSDTPKEIKATILYEADYPTTLNWCQTSKDANEICSDPKFWQSKLKTMQPNFLSINNPNPQLVLETLYKREHNKQLGEGSGNHNAVTLSEGIGIIAETAETQRTLNEFWNTQIDLGNFYRYVEYDHYHKNVILFRVIDKGVFDHLGNLTKFQSGRDRESFLMLLDPYDEDTYMANGNKKYLHVYQSIILTAFEKEMSEFDEDYLEENREEIPKLRQALLKLLNSPKATAGLWLMNDYF